VGTRRRIAPTSSHDAGGSLQELTLPDGFTEGPAPDGVAATELMMGFHGIPGVWRPVKGYGALVTFLSHARFGLTLDNSNAAQVSSGNLVLFAYDWRLSNRWTAKLLKNRVERALTRWRESAPQRRDAKVVFVCHSMGGFVARWYVEREGGAEITRSLVTFGTPPPRRPERTGAVGQRRASGSLAFARRPDELRSLSTILLRVAAGVRVHLKAPPRVPKYGWQRRPSASYRS
jgi:Lecithin:cholesterol acyltransferase